MKRKFLKIILMFSFAFLTIGCGTDGTTSSVDSLLSVETVQSEVGSLKNKMNIDFLLKSDYGSSVDVTLNDLSMSLSLCTVKSVEFTPSEIVFDATKQEENVHALVLFNEECVPDAYSIKGKSFLTLDSGSNEVSFDSGMIEITPSVEVETNTSSVVVSTDDTNDSTSIVIDDVTLPIVVIPNSLKDIKLTTNNKNIEISIKVFKDIAPYSEGTVKVELPTKVLAGVDVGLFDAYEVPVNEQGIATFNYTGPSNLEGLIDNNDLSSTFKFYHSDNSMNKQELTLNYEIDEAIYVPVDYSLTIVTKDSDFSMGIPNLEKTFSISIKDSKEDVVTDINITKIEVESQNTLVAKLLNMESKLLESKVELLKENNSNFILVSEKLSGIVPLKVVVEFIGMNNEKKTLSTVVNIIVMSGPPSAISISYLSTDQDTERAKYEEKFAVSVTDEYGNRVNTQPFISLGAIVGYAVDGREGTSRESNLTRRLFYGKEDIDLGQAEGVIDDLGDNDVHATTFSDATSVRSDVFKYVNIEGANSDKLLVFGRGKSYDAMGKWDFDKIDNSTLNLQDDYFGQTKGELYYAVGHNYYQDQCLEDGREWIGTTDSETYQLDNEGTVVVSYKYDYQLMGKDASIWVNLNGYQPDIAKNIRIGEVIKHTLRGQGLVQVPANGYSLEKGTSLTATFEIWQETTSEPYRNAHFGWSIEDGSTCAVTFRTSSNPYDARTCENGYSSEGRAYITFGLEAPIDKACTFNITRVLVASEF